jgi:hypothetical protein
MHAAEETIATAQHAHSNGVSAGLGSTGHRDVSQQPPTWQHRRRAGTHSTASTNNDIRTLRVCLPPDQRTQRRQRWRRVRNFSSTAATSHATPAHSHGAAPACAQQSSNKNIQRTVAAPARQQQGRRCRRARWTQMTEMQTPWSSLQHKTHVAYAIPVHSVCVTVRRDDRRCDDRRHTA